MNKCVFLRLRSKKGTKYLYCIKRRSAVEFEACRQCDEKVFKRPTPIKIARKTKETVSKETYNKVFARDKGQCALCGKQQDLHLHHVNGRGKGKTDNPDNCIMLCANCHLNVVHANNKKWRPILNEMLQKVN